MALSLTHAKHVTQSDGTDNTVLRPSDWNASHTLTGDAGNVLGIAPGGGTTVGQIPITTAAVAALAATDPGSLIGVPIGGTVIWWDDALPNGTNWAWANGGTVSAGASPVLLSRWGTKFGGDGVTTVGMPDLRERVPTGKATMGGAANQNLLSQFTMTSIGTLIGESKHVTGLKELVAHPHTITDPGHTHNVDGFSGVGLAPGAAGIDQVSPSAANSGTGFTNITINRDVNAGGNIVTITIATPGVVTWNSHGLTANTPVAFNTSGALPTGLTAGTVYYVVGASITANTFQVSSSVNGAAINTSGTQSGTQYIWAGQNNIQPGIVCNYIVRIA